ncbi:MAG TPA: hypothetical protein VJ825_02615 [Gemmatimonadaceae bacterium]|nr:hypothetical protein [Gemmatimonadaceae bacterium]
MIDASKLLANLPLELRDPLVEEYRGIATAYLEGRWKLSSLDAGRFCEVVYTILDGAVSGKFATSPTKPARFVDACRALESKAPIAVGDRSIRILIPRVLPGMYDIRNNRNVGHVGGDVVANKMDAAFLRDASTWVMAELVRVFHGVSTAVAQDAVDALVERSHPLIWEHEGKRRVLAPSMKTKDKILVLLHASPSGALTSDLQVWVKYKSKFREQILEPLAADLLVELNSAATHAVITPLGIRRVEESILTQYT